MHDTKKYDQEDVSMGVQGYVLKDSSPSELIAAIEAVHRGETFFSPKISQAVMNDYVRISRTKGKKGGIELSRRESEVLALIAEGMGNKEIAGRLFVSVGTVETHRERIIRKLDIHTVAGLTRYALTKGISSWINVRILPDSKYQYLPRWCRLDCLRIFIQESAKPHFHTWKPF